MSEPFDSAPSGPSKIRAWFLLVFTPFVATLGTEKDILLVPAWLVLCQAQLRVSTGVRLGADHGLLPAAMDAGTARLNQRAIRMRPYIARWVIGFAGVAWRRYLDQDRLNLGLRLLPEVLALVRPANTPSIRMLEKIGMRQVGRLDDVPDQEHSVIYRAACPLLD